MENVIIKIEKGSIAEELGIQNGDILVSINEKDIIDVFDYRYAISDEYIEVCIRDIDGEETVYEIEKDENEDLGLVFDGGLMDSAKSCKNKCIFCFIDQLPKGMRETLYFKDDDARLSFLSGNYITLTNVSEEDIDRIIYYHLSPINISVHATDPELRTFMLKNPNSDKVMYYIEKLYNAGIDMNFQIVLVKGVNDGKQLDRTINDLVKYVEKGRSLSVVPVGITRHREGLFEIEPFTKEDCASIITQLEAYQKEFKKLYKTRFVYAADELYIKGGLPIPSYSEYEDFPQIENGVGMIASMKKEFDDALKKAKYLGKEKHISIATAHAAYSFMCSLAESFMKKFPLIKISVYKIDNDFFGEQVTVSGLLTGGDFLNQLNERSLGEMLLIPKNALRRDDTVFLDDLDVSELGKQLNVQIKAVETSGTSLVKELCK